MPEGLQVFDAAEFFLELSAGAGCFVAGGAVVLDVELDEVGDGGVGGFGEGVGGKSVFCHVVFGAEFAEFEAGKPFGAGGERFPLLAVAVGDAPVVGGAGCVLADVESAAEGFEGAAVFFEVNAEDWFGVFHGVFWCFCGRGGGCSGWADSRG